MYPCSTALNVDPFFSGLCGCWLITMVIIILIIIKNKVGSAFSSQAEGSEESKMTSKSRKKEI